MKALFLVFHGFDEFNGISKKIWYQVKALKECGLDVATCHYEVDKEGHRLWRTDDEVLVDFGTTTWAKFQNRFSFGFLHRYIQKENIGFVYIRSYHNASPWTVRLVSNLRKQGVKVVMEIPTYPYDQEYTQLRTKCYLWIDQCFRHALARQLDSIVTFSNAESIFGKRTIRISNGIDFNAIPLRNHTNDTSNELHLIGVAEVHYWHGYDRLVQGLATYYRNQPTYKVYFHIVGELSGERERETILPVIRDNQLEPYVTLHGARHGQELDKLFDQADFAIGSLGRHRSGITHIKTLKNREYAARGLAFVYSETDDDFDHKPYVLKAPPDESPIDIARIIDFHRSLTLLPHQIRESIGELSWKVQMKRVIDECFTPSTTQEL